MHQSGIDPRGSIQSRTLINYVVITFFSFAVTSGSDERARGITSGHAEPISARPRSDSVDSVCGRRRYDLA